MSTTYNLQYRVKNGANDPWLAGPEGLPRVEGLISGVVTNLTQNTTYEFRFQRVVNGEARQEFSNIVEAATQSVATVASGGTISGTGTFSLSQGNNSATIVRSSSGVRISLGSANWVFVNITGVSPAFEDGSAFYARNKSGGEPVGVVNTNAIERTSTRSVDIYLNSSYAYSLIIRFGGNSTGTVTITAIGG